MGDMRPGLAVVLALVAASLSGCFAPDTERAKALFGANPLFSNGPTGDDVVQLRVAVLERSSGDRALNQELWQLVDEQVFDSDQKELLARNGFRVGRFSGSPPSALQNLLSSEKNCYGVPRCIMLRAGNPNTVSLGLPAPQSNFHLDLDGKKESVELRKAECQLQVVPVLSDNGRVMLRFTPSIKHGDLTNLFRPVRTPTGELEWKWEPQKVETYSALAWELTVDADDTVLIGTYPEADDTLGRRCFLVAEEGRRLQRLLVLRVNRAPTESCLPETLTGGLPLAIQAGASARGTAP
jgi:hypothetical protein